MSTSFSALAPAEDLLPALLDLSVGGVVSYSPLLDGAGQICDFAFAYLNPAAQRLLGLPAQPTATYCQQFAEAATNGGLAFHREAFLAGGEPRYVAGSYPAGGQEAYFRIAARRLGDGLLVSFTASNEHDQPEAERQRAALQRSNEELEERVRARTAQVREQQRLLRHVLESVPAAIATLSGPEHRFSFANARYQYLVGDRAKEGQAVAEALPEVVEQGVIELLDRVYQTGEPFIGRGVMIMLEQPPGPPHQYYYDLTYLPLHDEPGQVQGILVFAVEVTEQVRVRRQTTLLQAELLAAAQRQVHQREELYQVFEQAPAAIVLLREPDHRIEYVNPAYQQLFPEVALRGRLLGEAHPGIEANGTLARLDRVYETGEPYVGEEQPIELTLTPGQPAQTHYFNFVYQPYREEGRIVGVSVFAYDVTGATQARQQSARQARQFQELYEQAPMAVAILRGPDFIVELANPAILQLWGLPAEQALGRPRLELLPAESRASLRAVLETPYRTRQVHHVQELPVVLDRAHTGQPAKGYFNFIYQPLLDEQGEPVALTCVGIEVTEQVLARQQIEQLNQELEARVAARTQEARAAQAAAERGQAQLQALLTQAPVAIALFQGPEVRVASANERMAALWGRTPAQVLGRTLLEAVPELRGQGFEELIQQVLATGVPYVGTEAPATILKDGLLVVRYYNFSCQPIYGAQGELLGVLNVGVEVTEQVEARRALEQLNQELEVRVQARTRELSEQQALLGQILGQVPAFIATLSGPEHRFTFFNASYQALVAGRARLGSTVAEALPEVVAQGFIDLLDRVYATGEPFLGRGMLVQLHDAQTGHNEQRYLDFVYQPLRDGRQQVQGILAFIVDVTEQVLARQQVLALNEQLHASNATLEATNQQLTHTNADLDTFVYAASHDLKAPIANIEGLLGALREYLPTEAQQPMVPRLVGMMEKAITRFQQTVGHLTDIARLQEELPPPTETVDLATVLDGVRLDLLPLLESTRAELVLDLTECPAVHFSTKHLRSVLFNLLSNAVKYRAPDRAPLVHIRTHCTATHLVLEVQDNGLGLSQEQQAKLFAMFRRLHTHVEGSGVGLYLIKRTLENAGGTITVRSEPGVGSTFTVTIPRA